MKILHFLLVLYLSRGCSAFFRAQQGGVDISYKVTFLSTCRREKDPFRRILGLDLSECLTECGLRQHCEALSYQRRLQVCDLFMARDGEYLSNGECIYIAKSDIKVGKTSCEMCSNGQVCGINSEVCKLKECLRANMNENGVVLGNMNEIGSTVRYKCKPEYRDISGKMIAVCLENGTWNAVSHCKRVIKDCSDVKQCDPSYTEGEYWIFSDVLGGHNVKIYCHGMSTSSPSEYISVDHIHNYGFNAGNQNGVGRLLTKYKKIRVNMETMEIDRGDTTFTDPASSNFPYARAKRCLCGPGCETWNGYFKISTVGTGLMFSDQLMWNVTGWKPGISNFERNDDNTIIAAKCGGFCGYCDPVQPLRLHYNEGDVVEDGSATLPKCVGFSNIR